MTYTAGATPLAPLTASQVAVVRSSAQRLLIGAGAGSGKTSTVVQTICHLLGATVTDHEGRSLVPEARLELRQIAAITFTNQAAADLRRKMRLALWAAGLKHDAADVEAARIGTIHGFCLDLLREFALEAGLSPSFVVLDKVQAAVIGRAAADRALVEAVQGREASWLEPLTSGRTIKDVIAYIKKLADDTARLETYAAHRGDLRDHEERLLTLALRAVEIRRSEMIASGSHDFDSLLVTTRNMLRDRPEIRQSIQRRIRLLIVDEFQDVDPVQRDIAMLLAGMNSSDPAPSRLILVGDPKQSIFRFRRADVALWNSVADCFGANSVAGSMVELSDNFRSRKGILAFVDSVFGAALATPVRPCGTRAAFEVNYRSLRACGPNAVGDLCVELRCLPAVEHGQKRKVEDGRRLEARDVALRIAELHAEGRSYGDIAILLASGSDAGLFEAALVARGIRVHRIHGDGFWEAREILDCLLALRVIRDSAQVVLDTTALVGFLKSPFVSLRDDTILALARSSSGWRAAMRSEPRERVLLDRACAILDGFGSLRDRIPLSDLLQRLVSETGFNAALAADRIRGAQALANIRKLVRAAAAAGDLSLGEWLEGVADMRESAVEEPHERLFRERASVVTISSIHSAKGLEWPVVFWCDMAREAKDDTESLLLGRERFRLKNPALVGEDGKCADELFIEHRDDVALEKQAEIYRLWYVAATRPQQLLVLTGVPLVTPAPPKPPTKSKTGESCESKPVTASFRGCPADLILTAFATELAAGICPAILHYSHGDGTRFQMTGATVSVGEPDATAADSVELVRRFEASAVIKPDSLPCRAGRLQLSATRLMQFANGLSARSRLRIGRNDDASCFPGGFGDGDSALSGTLVHDVLERAGSDLGRLDELIDDAIGRHVLQPLSDAQRSAVRVSTRVLVGQVVEHRDGWMFPEEKVRAESSHLPGSSLMAALSRARSISRRSSTARQ